MHTHKETHAHTHIRIYTYNIDIRANNLIVSTEKIDENLYRLKEQLACQKMLPCYC